MIGHNPIGTNEWAKPQVLFWRLVVIGMFRLKTEVKGTSLHSGATSGHMGILSTDGNYIRALRHGIEESSVKYFLETHFTIDRTTV